MPTTPASGTNATAADSHSGSHRAWSRKTHSISWFSTRVKSFESNGKAAEGNGKAAEPPSQLSTPLQLPPPSQPSFVKPGLERSVTIVGLKDIKVESGLVNADAASGDKLTTPDAADSTRAIKGKSPWWMWAGLRAGGYMVLVGVVLGSFVALLGGQYPKASTERMSPAVSMAVTNRGSNASQLLLPRCCCPVAATHHRCEWSLRFCRVPSGSSPRQRCC